MKTDLCVFVNDRSARYDDTSVWAAITGNEWFSPVILTYSTPVGRKICWIAV